MSISQKKQQYNIRIMTPEFPASAALRGKEIVLGVCGGIAACKTPELVRQLRSAGAGVSCILTENGKQFVTLVTLRTLSGNPVYTDMFEPQVWDIEHISLAKKADIIVVAPATADALARLAAGRAEDLLSSVILATPSPVLLCPSMNERMWLHPATQENCRRLAGYGYRLVQPEHGELACGDTGYGRLANLSSIIAAIAACIAPEKK
jgi:phosphopantothenoylcysteine decarboxylase/phosphopantothenate--cysteine ligase